MANPAPTGIFPRPAHPQAAAHFFCRRKTLTRLPALLRLARDQKIPSPWWAVGVQFGARMSQTHPLTTTAFELPGYRIVKSFGVVRGIIVRSRSIFGNIGAGIQSIFGGNISLYTSLCERTRGEAFQQMLTHGGELGANAVIGVRYDATEIGTGITEVLCYGTAVLVEPAKA